MKLFTIPEDLGALDAESLQTFITETRATLAKIGAAPEEFVTAERSYDALKAEVVEAAETVKQATELLAAFEAESVEGEGEGAAEAEGADGGEGAGDGGEGDGGDAGAGADGDGAGEGEGEGADGEAAAAEIAALATEASTTPKEEPKPVVASARRPPARSRAAAPVESAPMVALVAAAGADDRSLGAPFENDLDLAKALMRRRHQFGSHMPDGAENVSVARADWRHLYPPERNISGSDVESQAGLLAAAVDPKVIRANFAERFKKFGGAVDALTASGGLCAPVTPYYNLMMISQADRPVRAALPAFNADRGGIRAALPASLSAITTGVGQLTVAQDAAGGTTGTKTCQSVDCPSFVETDVEILYHCLRFGNLGARTFPERVAQWNNLVLAMHARFGDRLLLTGIDAASTQVTANSLGLGASADLLSQVLVAAAAMRNRHRMDPAAVLRVLFPEWVKNLIVSDVYRSQFQRWDMTPERFVALLRQGGVEPTFYIDSASGKSQEFGSQGAAALLNYPSTVTWYLFPEGSFLYLDGGILELGLVRDSTLNSTNDFEIFGESFENVAYIGVESLAITSTLCDSGITAGTHNPTCPIVYSMAT